MTPHIQNGLPGFGPMFVLFQLALLPARARSYIGFTTPFKSAVGVCLKMLSKQSPASAKIFRGVQSVAATLENKTVQILQQQVLDRARGNSDQMRRMM